MILGRSVTKRTFAGRYARAGGVLAIICALCLGLAWELRRTACAQANTGGHQPKSEGQRIYEKANCVGCHKWHGGGGGSYGGSALSLRDTQLNRDQVIEVVHCGRPGTGMPRHDRDAYIRYPPVISPHLADAQGCHIHHPVLPLLPDGQAAAG